ncbi:MAG: MotA/TolQ/ExbB proton channel family protein [Verrucomicrobiota bacterium]|nr:MotA/TolQ/ExbB proton channel family protein [Verrucomicrobiota bacterium]
MVTLLKNFIVLTFILISSGCVENDTQELAPDDLIKSLRSEGLTCELLKYDSKPDLIEVIKDDEPFGLYKGDGFSFALYNINDLSLSELNDKNGTLTILQNKNLILIGKGSNGSEYIKVFNRLKPNMSLDQLGIFLYPLGFCILIVIFISSERIYSLRPGLTFPRKVAKALRTGEFPNRKWKKRSAAERIVWVATKENPSIESLRSYARLEVNSMERGLFLLEVVISGAPLVGLLGTVTGLVKVFSQIPAGGGVGDTAIFSEGIAMALLTTIMGIAIAIPTLFLHSYLVRLVDKRASSIGWLTERLIDAVYSKEDSEVL